MKESRDSSFFDRMGREEAWETAHRFLLSRGWIAATNPHNFLRSFDTQITPRQEETMVEAVVEFAIHLGDIDPIEDVVFMETLDRRGQFKNKTISIDKFVRQYGGRKWEDKLYQGLMETSR